MPERDFERREPKLVHGHHHVRSLDDGVSFGADGEAEGLRGSRRDGGDDLFTSGVSIVTSQNTGPSLMSMILPSMQLRAEIFILFLLRGGHEESHEVLMDGTLYGDAKVVNLYL